MDNQENREIIKEKLTDLLGSGLSIPIGTLNILRSNCIYVYLNGKDILYVGKSQNGILRALDRRHSKKVISECDELLIFKSKDFHGMIKAERLLINTLKPKYNIKIPKLK